MSFSHSSISFERLIRDVVTEMMRSGQSYTSRGAPFTVARHSDYRHPQPILKPFSGYRISGVLVQDRNEIWHRRQNFVSNTSDQIFVLEVDLHRLTAKIIRALNDQLPEIPTFFDSPIEIDNLALKQARAFGHLEQFGKNIFLVLARRTQSSPNATAKAHHSRKRCFLGDPPLHRVESHKSKATHPYCHRS